MPLWASSHSQPKQSTKTAGLSGRAPTPTGFRAHGLAQARSPRALRWVQPCHWQSRTMRVDGPSRMGKRPTGSGGEPSSPNCGASAGVKARQPLLENVNSDKDLAFFLATLPHFCITSVCHVTNVRGHHLEAPNRSVSKRQDLLQVVSQRMV